MGRKRKADATRLDEVDRTMYSSFCSAANSISQLYAHAMNHQKISFQAGERHALEKLYQWILRQHEQGSRVTISDIASHIQHEIDHGGEDAAMSPRLQHQQQCPPSAMHFPNSGLQAPSASFGQPTLGLAPRPSLSDQSENSVFSNALSSPVRRSLQPYQLAHSDPTTGNNARNHDPPSSNDTSMDMHSDSPTHGSY